MTGSFALTFYLKTWVRKMNLKRLVTWTSRCKKPWPKPMNTHGISSKPAWTSIQKERTGRYRSKSERDEFLTMISRMSMSMRVKMILAVWEARSRSKILMSAISTGCLKRGRASLTLRDSRHHSTKCLLISASLTYRFKQTSISHQGKVRKTLTTCNHIETQRQTCMISKNSREGTVQGWASTHRLKVSNLSRSPYLPTSCSDPRWSRLAQMSHLRSRKTSSLTT